MVPQEGSQGQPDTVVYHHGPGLLPLVAESYDEGVMEYFNYKTISKKKRG